jgi:hypothetical protein
MLATFTLFIVARQGGGQLADGHVDYGRAGHAAYMRAHAH